MIYPDVFILMLIMSGLTLVMSVIVISKLLLLASAAFALAALFSLLANW